MKKTTLIIFANCFLFFSCSSSKHIDRFQKIQYKSITRKVVVTPASTQEIAVDAQYETVRVKELASAASEERTVIPAVYKTVQKRELVTDGQT